MQGVPIAHSNQKGPQKPRPAVSSCPHVQLVSPPHNDPCPQESLLIPDAGQASPHLPNHTTLPASPILTSLCGMPSCFKMSLPCCMERVLGSMMCPGKSGANYTRKKETLRSLPVLLYPQHFASTNSPHSDFCGVAQGSKMPGNLTCGQSPGTSAVRRCLQVTDLKGMSEHKASSGYYSCRLSPTQACPRAIFTPTLISRPLIPTTLQAMMITIQCR